MPTVSTVIANPGVEEGDTGWTKGTGWVISTTSNPYAGTYAARNDTDDSGEQSTEIINANVVSVTPGFSITATARVYGAGADGNIGAVFIDWLDSGFSRISKSQGNSSSNSSPGKWQTSTVTATAPAGAAYAGIGAWCNTESNGVLK